jgi:hypothetical protein
MSSDDSAGPVGTATALLGVLAVLASVPGVAVSLATSNGLVTGSAWQRPALLSVAVVAITLAAVVLAGGPSRRWRRTPYW